MSVASEKNVPSLCSIINAIYDNDQELLIRHISLIKKLYEVNTKFASRCSCGCTNETTIFDILTGQVDVYNMRSSDDGPTDRQLAYLDCIKFLVESNAIDPDFMFDEPPDEEEGILRITTRSDIKILLSGCLECCILDYEIQRADYIFSVTSLDTICKYRNEYNSTIAHMIFQAYTFPEPEIADRWFEKMTLAKLDFSSKIYCENGYQTPLYLACINVNVKYVDFFLNLGQDPNDSYFLDGRRRANTIQWLLYNRRYMKNEKWITCLTHVCDLLLRYGLDLSYCDTDGRNVMDYLHRYGWYDTSVYKIIAKYVNFSNDLVDMHNPYDYVHKIIINYTGFSEKNITITGNIPSFKRDYGDNIKEVEYESMSSAMKLLFDNRYEKSLVQIALIVEQLKVMKIDFEYKDSKKNTLYRPYCANYYWKNTPVYDYLSSIR